MSRHSRNKLKTKKKNRKKKTNKRSSELSISIQHDYVDIGIVNSFKIIANEVLLTLSSDDVKSLLRWFKSETLKHDALEKLTTTVYSKLSEKHDPKEIFKVIIRSMGYNSSTNTIKILLKGMNRRDNLLYFDDNDMIFKNKKMKLCWTQHAFEQIFKRFQSMKKMKLYANFILSLPKIKIVKNSKEDMLAIYSTQPQSKHVERFCKDIGLKPNKATLIGYMPYVINDDKMICKTFLVPGMKNTPEQDFLSSYFSTHENSTLFYKDECGKIRVLFNDQLSIFFHNHLKNQYIDRFRGFLDFKISSSFIKRAKVINEFNREV